MNLRGLFCTGLLIFATGCGAQLPQSVSTADELPSATGSLSSSVMESSSSPEASEAPDLSSIPDSSISSTAPALPGDEAMEWDSVYAATTVVTNRGASWYIWENTVEDGEAIRALWEIVQATKKTKPSEDDSAPEGGFPFEVTFISESRSIECFFHSINASIDGVSYHDFNRETYNRILELAGASEFIQSP